MHTQNTNIETNSKESGKASKTIAVLLGTVAIAAIIVVGIRFVDVDQTQEARLPEVSVDVTEGQLPTYDVDVADVSLEQKSVDVTVPTMDVETETRTVEIEVPVDVETGSTEETVQVPTLDVTLPAEDNPADNPTQ